MITLASGIVALAVTVLVGGKSLADDEPFCGDILSINGLARVSQVGSDRRLHFNWDDRGWPCDSLACQQRAYLLLGDEVLTAQRHGRYTCVFYKPKGRQLHSDSSGWVRSDALRPIPAPASPPPTAWDGVWVRNRDFGLVTELAIRAAGHGRLRVAGDAAFAHSRDDAKHGVINFGEVKDVIDVRGNTAGLLITGPGGAMQSVRAKDHNYDCKIGMKLVGDWLAVADDLVCGGLNVTFTGIYRRER